MSKYEYVVEFGYKPPSTVPDVIKEEIVRCRDCSWFCEGSEVYATSDWCKNFGCETDEDGYCAWSKRGADA